MLQKRPNKRDITAGAKPCTSTPFVSVPGAPCACGVYPMCALCNLLHTPCASRVWLCTLKNTSGAETNLRPHPSGTNVQDGKTLSLSKHSKLTLSFLSRSSATFVGVSCKMCHFSQLVSLLKSSACTFCPQVLDSSAQRGSQVQTAFPIFMV